MIKSVKVYCSYNTCCVRTIDVLNHLNGYEFTIRELKMNIFESFLNHLSVYPCFAKDYMDNIRGWCFTFYTCVLYFCLPLSKLDILL